MTLGIMWRRWRRQAMDLQCELEAISVSGRVTIRGHDRCHETLAPGAEQRLSTFRHELRAGLVVSMFGILQNGVEVLARAQWVQPRVTLERFIGKEPSGHDVREDFHCAIEVPCVREADQLVEEPFGIPEA